MLLPLKDMFSKNVLTMSVEDKKGLVGKKFFKKYDIDKVREDKSLNLYHVDMYEFEKDTFDKFALLNMVNELKELEGVTVYNVHMEEENNFGKYLINMSKPSGGISSIQVYDNGELKRLEQEREEMLKEMY